MRAAWQSQLVLSNVKYGGRTRLGGQSSFKKNTPHHEEHKVHEEKQGIPQ
jgi:hypothetical protein